MQDWLLLIWIITSLSLNLISIVIYFFYSRSNYNVNVDQVEAVKKLIELFQKEFSANTSQHKELLENLSENDQKLLDQISDAKKNIYNLAVFLGYRPRNIDDF